MLISVSVYLGLVYNVPEGQQILKTRNAASKYTSGVYSVRVLCWSRGGSVLFHVATIMVHDVYGDTIDDIAPVVAGSEVSSLLEDDKNSSLDSSPLSRNSCM